MDVGIEKRRGNGSEGEIAVKAGLGRRMASAANDMRHAAWDIAADFKDRAETATRKARKNARQHPAAWVATSLGAGALLGWAIGRNGKRPH
jgi:hypothetical protein